MTSNLGTEIIQSHVDAFARGGEAAQEVKREVLDLLRRSIRPEFLNRIDEIIVFRSLNRDDLHRIVDIQLARIIKRLEQQDITLKVQADAKDLILRGGYDPSFGARPLKRALQHLLLDPLSEEILSGKILPGQTLSVNAEKGRLTFEST
jgi:ATP-dependent Clp protease ATP-binding subunit ClpA